MAEHSYISMDSNGGVCECGEYISWYGKVSSHGWEMAAHIKKANEEWEPGRWWQVLAPDGSLWCETSVEEEARERMRPGDRLYRLMVRHEERWKEVS